MHEKKAMPIGNANNSGNSINDVRVGKSRDRFMDDNELGDLKEDLKLEASNVSHTKKKQDMVLQGPAGEELLEQSANGGMRKKLRLSKKQSALLEESFKQHSTLNQVI